MIKKQNHKIFNLIVMIFIYMMMFSVLNISYASEKDFLNNQENFLVSASDAIFTATEDEDTGSMRDFQPDEYNDVNHTKSDSSMWSYVNNNELFKELRKNVALWYTIFRYFSIACMLVTLIILGIKLAISSIAQEKALYKKAIVNWFVCFILLFFIHYFMIFVLYLNETLINWFRDFSQHISEGQEYGLYETARSRAYDIHFTVGFTGMMMYMALVYLTVKYIFMYLKRTIVIIILTIISPIIILIYSLQNILSGKNNSKILSKWMEEYATNVLLQSIHALVYAVFVGLALKLSHESVIGFLLSFIFLNFLTKADKIFRNIFKFSEGSKMSDDIEKTSLSDIKDTAFTALGTIAIAKKTGVGQKISGVYSSLGRQAMKPVIRAGSAIENSKLGQTVSGIASGIRENLSNAKINRFNDKINNLENQINALTNVANNTIDNKQRLALEDRIKKLQYQKQKVENSLGNYNFRRGLYQRIRHTFDPDAYMEDYVKEIEVDEEGNKTYVMGRRVAKAEKIFDKRSQEYITIGGLKNIFSENSQQILNLSKDDKALLKELRKDVSDGVMGFGGMILGMGMIVDNPSIGLALIASGGNKLRKLNKNPNESLKINRKFKKKLKFAETPFSTGSLLSIDKEIKSLTSSDPSVGRINNIMMKLQSGNLKYMIPAVPFILTGTAGMLNRAFYMERRMIEQHLKDVIKFELGVDLEVMKSLTNEIVDYHKKYISTISTNILKSNNINLMFKQRISDGTIVFNNEQGTGFAFNTDRNMDILSPESRFRQAVIDTAMQNHIYDLNRFNLDNEYTKKALFQNMIKQGYIDSSVKGIDNIISKNKQLFEKIKQEEPDLIRKKIFESVVIDYIKEMDISSVDELKTSSAYSAMSTRYLDTISSGHQDIDMKNIIINTFHYSGAPYDALDEKDIANIMKEDHPEEYARFLQDMQSSGMNISFEEAVKQKKQQLDKSFDDMILGALINENITKISDIDLYGENDPTIISFKANLMAYFQFAGFSINDEALLDIIQSKIDSLSDEDIQKNIIQTEISRYIEESCDGDAEKLNDSRRREELNEIIEKKLFEFYDSEKQIDNASEIAEKISEQKNQSENSSDSENSSQYGFEDGNSSNNNEENNLDINIPLPTIENKISDDGIVRCQFGLPRGYEDYIIESCVKTLNSSSKFISNLTMCSIANSEESACARLVKNGKYGPTLTISYPKDAVSVIKKLRDSSEIEELKEKETRKRNKGKQSRLDNVAGSVLNSIEEFSTDDSKPEDIFGSEIIERSNDNDVESEFKKMQIQKQKNNVERLITQIQKTKSKFVDADEKTRDTVDNIIEQVDSIGRMSFEDDDEESYNNYRKDVNNLTKKLLEIKMLDEDTTALKIKNHSTERKKYKKLKEEYESKVRNINIDDIINQINEGSVV